MPIKLQTQKVITQTQEACQRLFNIKSDFEVKLSPRPEFGDFTIECFDLAKKLNNKPIEIAQVLAAEIQGASAVGPYLNFKIDYQKFSKELLGEILTNKEKYGQSNLGKKQKIILEFAHPNTHKAFHIGHLRNIITGESLARILENSGYKIIRANYQGDVGLHIAKCLYNLKSEKLKDKIKLLSQAYVAGNKAYEENEEAKKEIQELNQKIYQQDKSIKKIYQQTRQWSLDYFDKIYKRLDTKFDRLYFESEVFEKGKKIVLQNPNIFKKSEGAVIFEGEKYNLHNRVFINSKGQATYEAKDLALAELQLKEYNPDKIIHLVGPEQSEYFKVLFKALEFTLPTSKNREMHLPYGWVRLKKGKMSSRLGNVIAGEWLLDEVKKRLNNQEEIAQAAIKYSILKTNRQKDMAFDIKKSINLFGDSGPYLQYTHARIKSILRKQKASQIKQTPELLEQEKNIILKLSLFPDIIEQSVREYEPSIIAKYLFDLAQIFSNYYHQAPILKAEANKKFFRLNLIKAISIILKRGLCLLGITAPEKM
ncbi:MAG: arginine--tRNA ligase [Candidatus Portnoybacteria bacterium CG23_combo_of_CG06-09_8_20_14_all_37_13]|uniref:Arginine--tRNA ligase n=1 Tax=Candidatus Portnoybacteria bacterium CG23_combo_of_CG06-09_8_20_14_all_37_13 TaxID=1974819 RepID=A0A2G9YFK2_9BACT|nr:MAG: arginine--tRNA ligase [Candidatus Portnoybacteria bacterium CG23_combo_of_CG06-09_8_20_14_all_37_13]